MDCSKISLKRTIPSGGRAGNDRRPRHAARSHRLRWGFLLAALCWLAFPGRARADYYDYPSLEVIGNLTVDPYGMSLFGYYSGYPYYTFDDPSLSVGALYLDGYQIDSSGTITNYPGVNDGDYVTFANLTASELDAGGNITIEGNLNVGNLSIGEWSNGTANFSGINAAFYDDNSGFSGNVFFKANPGNVNWIWAQDHGQMTLDSGGNLTLEDSTSGNALEFTPGASPSTAPTIKLINNSTVLATLYANFSISRPNTIFNDDGVLSMGGGNLVLDGSSSTPEIDVGAFSLQQTGAGLVLSSNTSGNTITLDVDNASINLSNGLSVGGNDTEAFVGLGNLGLAIGYNATVSAPGAVAIGVQADASGTGAIAFNQGTASGNHSIAFDSGVSSGASSLSFFGNATGDDSTALGNGTTADTWGTFTLGEYNQEITGNATAWSSIAPAFIVGSGNGTTSVNGMVIYNNGTATFGGNLNVSDSSHQMEVEGASLFNGTVTFGGNVSFAAPAGDIHMGEYGD